MKPRSVMFVAPSAFTLSGLATWLDYLLPGLVQSGWQVTLGICSGPRYHLPEKYLAVHPFDSVRMIHCRDATAHSRIESVRKAIQDVKPDVVVSVNIPDSLRAVALERNQGRAVKGVMSIHGLQEDLFNDLKRLNVAVDAVVATNRLACRLSEQLAGFEKDRIFHCACGTHIGETLEERCQADPPTIAFSGRLDQPEKRVFDLPQIALGLERRNCPFRFLVAGSGPDESRLKSKIADAGLSKKFELLGFVSPEQMSDRVYRRSDLLLVTSSSETGPIVIWEAMAQGLPVVSSRYIGSGLENILEHGTNCMLFEVGDTESAAAAVLSLSQDKRKAHSIAESAFECAKRKLSWKASVHVWDDALRQIIDLEQRPNTQVSIESDSGRLSRMLGSRLASRLRNALHRLPPDSGPGGEWPHALSGSQMAAGAFLKSIAHLDRREDAGPGW